MSPRAGLSVCRRGSATGQGPSPGRCFLRIWQGPRGRRGSASPLVPGRPPQVAEGFARALPERMLPCGDLQCFAPIEGSGRGLASGQDRAAWAPLGQVLSGPRTRRPRPQDRHAQLAWVLPPPRSQPPAFGHPAPGDPGLCWCSGGQGGRMMPPHWPAAGNPFICSRTSASSVLVPSERVRSEEVRR